MAEASSPDDSTIAKGLIRWLGDRWDGEDMSVGEFRRPSAGFSSETILVEAAWVVEGVRQRASLVVRTAPPGAGTFRHYDLRAQFQAQRAAAAAGVAIADPVFEPDPRWIGTQFIVMPRVDGHIIDGLAHADRWLRRQSEPAQHQIYKNFLVALSTIHRADAGLAGDVPRRDNAAELDFWEDYLDWSSDGSPVATLADALRWCRSHRPEAEPPATLLWGDARFENVVFGDDLQPRAVLDWDMTSIGAAEHDLAWFTSLDSTMERLFARRTPGLPGREETVALFEELAGRPVLDLEWYETLAMVRSTAIMTRIGYLRQAAGEPPMLPIDDNPILDLVRERIAPV
jgi:aminoglycoside phosphotransferase (APT) family kinase protein